MGFKLDEPVTFHGVNFNREKRDKLFYWAFFVVAGGWVLIFLYSCVNADVS